MHCQHSELFTTLINSPNLWYVVFTLKTGLVS